MKIKSQIYNNALFLSVTWALIILILCATPGQYIPSANWLELLSFDKFVHASIFFIQSSLLFIVAFKYKQSSIFFRIYFLIALCYGASLELMQAYCFSNRGADWKDMVANAFGCIVAFVILKKIKGLFHKELVNTNKE